MSASQNKCDVYLSSYVDDKQTDGTQEDKQVCLYAPRTSRMQSACIMLFYDQVQRRENEV